MMTRNDIVNSKREACIKAAAESKREVAQKMKADGLEPSLIAKYSGLTVEDVEAL